MEALERLRALPRFGLGKWPTPIERHPTLGGREVWVKRDDLSGLGRGGAKARKIDLLLAHLRARGVDELITVAGNVTNLAFDLLPVLEGAGIKATLFISDHPRLDPRSREQIFAGVRDRVVFLGASNLRAFAAASRAYVAAKLRGGRPFLLLPGVTHPSGILGNALGFIEMIDQLEGRGEPLPRTVFVTAATGTTLAGFALAERALFASGRPPIRIVGVQVHAAATRIAVRALALWTRRFLGLRVALGGARIEVDTRMLGGGFGRYDAELERMCGRLESKLGWSIDPIFGGKTWRAMESTRETGPTLYWHCGYTPEWRSLGEAVRRGS